uniref:BED-type domain-containing protein n=1 Tax=Amphimedon queenslandica TaxID=400682 RepID=A0A1X7U4J1_AMPQE
MPTTEDPSKICGKTLKGNFPTNLKKHLKKMHPAVLKEIEEAEKVSKENRKDTSSGKQRKAQLTLETSLEHHNRYTESSIQYKAITTKLAIFVGSTNVGALSLVENQEFRDLLLALDKRYQVPSRKKISKEIDAVCVSMKTNIQSLLDKARKINLCVDIWSKPGMTASFLGVTSQFIVENKSHTICLAVRRFPSPHTSQRIAEFLYNIVTE